MEPVQDPLETAQIESSVSGEVTQNEAEPLPEALPTDRPFPPAYTFFDSPEPSDPGTVTSNDFSNHVGPTKSLPASAKAVDYFSLF